jgi:predicted RNA binding protein YcfA (HicA-like mRNA interferase family)
MSRRLPQLKPKEVIRALERLGFVNRRQTGSHVVLRHPINKYTTVVPLHTKEIKRGLLFGIIKQAGLSQQNFFDAL